MPLASDSADRKIRILDEMYDKGIKLKNSQNGSFAIINNTTGEKYLVSSKVKGAKPNYKTNKFNNQNLQSLSNVLADLDTPTKISDKSYGTSMHYDLHSGNINITEDSAGILDFEFIKPEDFDSVQKRHLNYECASWPDLSDIPGVVSNLRGFEYKTLHGYIKKMNDKNEAKDLFYNYVSNIKPSYYEKLARKTKDSDLKLLYDTANKDFDKSFSTRCSQHQHYAKNNTNPNYIKAEAIKIQIANFQGIISPYNHSTSEKINPDEVKEYIINANEFFDKQLKNAKSEDEKAYFQDCKELMKDWNDTIGQIDNLTHWFKKNLKPFNFENEDIYNAWKNEADIFLNKLTTEHVTTLDEIVV